MPHFTFTGRGADGAQAEGAEEALDRFDLARKLRAKGVRVISVSESKEGAAAGGNFSAAFARRFSRVTLEEKIFFANNMSAMLSAGLALSRSLAVIQKQNKNPALSAVLTSLSADISQGSSLSDAMKKFPNVFSVEFVAMVAAGEASGKLADALSLVGSQLSKTYATRRKIKSALLYPGIILSLAVVIGIVLLVYIVPTLASTFVALKIELPLSTRIIIAFSEFMKSYFLFAIAAFGLGVFLFRKWLRTKNGSRIRDALVLKMPLIGKVVRNMNSAVTARTLASLVASGVDIVGALDTTRSVLANSYYRDALEEAQSVVQKGGTVASVFEKRGDLYPTLLGEMVEVGEETGKLSDMLLRVAIFYEEQVDAVTKDLSTLIEPFLMIIIGGIVMFFAVSMIQPIYSITGAV